MNRFFVNVLCAFLPKKQWRRWVRVKMAQGILSGLDTENNVEFTIPKFTLIYPAYLENNINIKDIVEYYDSYPLSIKRLFKIIIIDDHSPVNLNIESYDLNIQIYRIRDDIPWNQAGARNLGACIADTEYLLLSDLDHTFPVETIERLLQSKLKQKQIVRFERYLKGSLIKEAPNIVYLKKSTFFELGCMDEDFCGHYGYEDTLFYELAELNGCEILRSGLRVDVGKVKIESLKDIKLSRDLTVNRALYNKKTECNRTCTDNSYSVVRFSWSFVSSNQIQ